MIPSRWLARFGSSARRRAARRLILAPREFEHAALCERMRVDRNGSTLAILYVQLSRELMRAESLEQLGEVLTERLRLTDTIGRLKDGRLGLLLPDTEEAGAWKVARDLQEFFTGGNGKSGGLPDCEVLIYPERSTPKSIADEPWTDQPVNDRQPVNVAATADRAVTQIDAVFAQPMPLWKRSTDLLFGSLGLLAATPVIAVCAGAVALTSAGNPFYKQQREGLGGRRFNMWKIRTMHVDAEQQRDALLDHSDQDGPAFKMHSDPRVTRVGRVLRKLSLDELPQLLNVVRGEMSLVGPRPLPVHESQQCSAWQRQRLAVTPGITCTWQVYGRNIVPFDEWVRMDLSYIRRRSPWQDFKLLVSTGPSLISLKGPR